jgi:nitrate reductase NapE component
MSEDPGSTQPNIKAVQPGRGKRFLFNALGVIVLLAIAIVTGFRSGIGTRQSYQSSVMSGQLSEQFTFALVDIQFGAVRKRQTAPRVDHPTRPRLPRRATTIDQCAGVDEPAHADGHSLARTHS